MTEEQRRRAARVQALRYRIWAFCAPRGWDVTITEIAEELGISWQSARATLQWTGWLDRVRVVKTVRDNWAGITGAWCQGAGHTFPAGEMIAADIRRKLHGDA